MISAQQVDRLQDQLDRFIAMLVSGCLFFFVGTSMAVFASQEFFDGTNFMLRLAGGEQMLGALLILVGWIKVRSINAQLARHAPQRAEQARAAQAGH